METQTTLDFKHLRAVLDEYGKDVITNYRDELLSGDHKATGNLINNLKYNIKQSNYSISVNIELEDYWKYIEEGTKPHWPPVNKILEWVKVKPVIPSKTYNGKLPTDKQLAFLISRKISEVGTKAYHPLRKTLEELNTWYEERIYDAIGQDIDEEMDIILLRAFQSSTP